jgi:RNA polymerase sigma-70 factor, ECF subfamily
MELVLGTLMAPGAGEPETDAQPDATLMARYAQGDRQAFEVLYYRHRAGLYRYIGRLLPRKANADEAFQDTWMAVIRGRERYEPAAKFSTFLFSIAHRRVMDRLRRAGRRPESGISLDLEDPAPGPDRLAQSAVLGGAMQAALLELPFAQREAFLLRAEAGLSLDEIATVTVVPFETAKSRLKYANRALRAMLEGWT